MTALGPKLRAVFATTSLTLVALGVLFLVAPSAATATVTCAVTVSSENLMNNAVQSAINAFPGQNICLGAGTFPEQLTINVTGTSLIGAGSTKTFIAPTALSINTHDIDSASSVGNAASLTPAAAIILVTNTSTNLPTTGVSIRGLTVNGTGGSSTFTGCGTNYFGVAFQNASGTLANSAVVGVALPAPDFGCQDGLAVYVYNGHFYSGLSPSTAVTVTGTKVVGYDKNGITCDDPGVACTLTGNTVTGAGVVNNNAQNGIQVAYGATAHVAFNHVNANGYNGTTATNSWYGNGYAASGILLFDSGNGTTVTSNSLTLDQLGIAYFDDGSFDGGSANTTITFNTVKESSAYGIVANGAAGGRDNVNISGNTVSNKVSLNPTVFGAPGILVDTGNFLVATNHVFGASASGTNGPSQEVCGPNANTGTGTPFLSCSTYSNETTAAIQAVSESSTNPTSVTLKGNTYAMDVAHIATRSVLGGVVNLTEIS